MELYSISEGNQNELIHYVEVKQSWLNAVQAKYNWEHFDEYDNRMFEYMDELFDVMTEQKLEQESYHDFWKKLTRSQKVFWAFLSFNGDMDNGGVYQFFFNKPEHSLSVLEVWEELKVEKLKLDYHQVLEEVVGKFDKIVELRQYFSDESHRWEQRWQAFTNGYNELKSTAVIESYYYNEYFKKELYWKMSEYIEANLTQFLKIKVE